MDDRLSLAMTAESSFVEQFGTRVVDLTVEKQLPEMLLLTSTRPCGP